MAKIFKPQTKVKQRKHKSTARQMADFTGVVQHYDHEGKGIIRTEQGHIAFVPGVMAGERVRVRPKTYTDKIIHGSALNILEPSSERIQAKCGHFGTCGGCQLQYMSSAQQVAIKQEALDTLFKKQLSLADIPWQPTLSGADWGYRRTARLAIWFDKADMLTLGFRQPGSKQIVDIEACPILAEKLMPKVLAIKPVLLTLSHNRKITHIQVFQLEHQSYMILRTLGQISQEDKNQLQVFARSHQCSLLLEYDKHQFESLWPQQATETEHNPAILNYQLDDLTFEFQPQNFIQINQSVNEQMVQQALDWLALKPEDRVLDLFSGVGNFTLPLAKRVKEVMAVEGVNDMVTRLKQNAILNGLENVTAHQADLSQLEEKRKPKWLKPIDKLLLDPARDGAFAVVKKIPLLAPKQILYVSCNPATMARDLKHLLSADYRLTKIGLLNMFPHTSHVEAMALLEK